MKKGVRIAGEIFIWLGVILLLNSFVGITGLAIGSLAFQDSVKFFQPVFFAGLGFLFAGLLMMGLKGRK